MCVTACIPSHSSPRSSKLPACLTNNKDSLNIFLCCVSLIQTPGGRLSNLKVSRCKTPQMFLKNNATPLWIAGSLYIGSQACALEQTSWRDRMSSWRPAGCTCTDRQHGHVKWRLPQTNMRTQSWRHYTWMYVQRLHREERKGTLYPEPDTTSSLKISRISILDAVTKISSFSNGIPNQEGAWEETLTGKAVG